MVDYEAALKNVHNEIEKKKKQNAGESKTGEESKLADNEDDIRMD